MGAWVNNSHVTSMFTGTEQLKTQKVKIRLDLECMPKQGEEAIMIHVVLN